MYYHIEGILSHKEIIKDIVFAVIDCGGVGYKLNISQTTYIKLPEIGGKVKLFAHLIVKEDALDLLGFYDLNEKNAFIMLTSVSGIGAKTAMNVLSVLTPERFAFAIASGDYKELSQAHGVSAKTAQKIILELKDKISKESGENIKSGLLNDGLSGLNDVLPANNNGMNSRSDAIVSLIALGYTRAEALEGIKNIELNKPFTLEEIIKLALKNLAK